MLKGEVAYAGHVKGHADAVKALSDLAGEVFPESSAVGESRVKPVKYAVPLIP